MDLSELLDPSRVVANLRATSKDQVLRDISARASPHVGVDAQTIYSALEAREGLGSTGMGGGFALPHAKLEGLDRLFGLFVRLARPVPFDAVDDNPVDLVFLLLIPKMETGDHLAALAAICRRLRDPALATKLREAESGTELYALLCAPQRA